MASGNNPNFEGYVDCIRLAWAVHLMLINDAFTAKDTISSASSNDLVYLRSCLDVIFSNNVFQFILDKVLRTAAYQVCYDFSFYLIWFLHIRPLEPNDRGFYYLTSAHFGLHLTIFHNCFVIFLFFSSFMLYIFPF